MTKDEMSEFIIMLLLEKKCEEDVNFFLHLQNYNVEEFNSRYMQLLDNFLTRYALDTTEKSE